MKTYDIILQGDDANYDYAIEFAQGFDFSDVGLKESSTVRSTYVDTVDGIDVWYNYGADYYFFAPTD